MNRSEATLQVNSVLYGNNVEDIRRTVENLDRAADIAIAGGKIGEVRLTYGDCSPTPVLSPEFLASLRSESAALASIEHVWFDANLGSARGHNTLLQKTSSDFVLIMNPDVRLAPNCLVELIAAFSDPKVGMVEAKQLPIEHPKAFTSSGETSWAATACAMFKKPLLDTLNGFDAETFFLYCDDVDISWRVRLEGLKVIYQASAAVFHDKRLGHKGAWQVGAAEKYYSAEAALLLAYKYSRDDILKNIVADFKVATDPVYAKALAEFERRSQEGLLPVRVDADHAVGEFTEGAYAVHRFRA